MHTGLGLAAGGFASAARRESLRSKPGLAYIEVRKVAQGNAAHDPDVAEPGPPRRGVEGPGFADMSVKPRDAGQEVSSRGVRYPGRLLATHPAAHRAAVPAAAHSV